MSLANEVAPVFSAAFEQTPRGGVDHAHTWIHANWRPFYTRLVVSGFVADVLLANVVGDQRPLKLLLHVEYEGGTPLRFKAKDELRIQLAGEYADDHHKVQQSHVAFVAGRCTLVEGELPLWNHFELVDRGPSQATISCKMHTNITTRQHQGKRFQIRAELRTADLVARCGGVEAITQAVPFAARKPPMQQTRVELISDFKPGDKLTLFGECLRSVNRGIAPVCDLRRSTDGAVWRLAREAKQGRSPSMFVTRLPGDLSPGQYTLRISNVSIGVESEILAITIVPSDHRVVSLPPPVAPTGPLARADSDSSDMDGFVDAILNSTELAPGMSPVPSQTRPDSPARETSRTFAQPKTPANPSVAKLGSSTMHKAPKLDRVPSSVHPSGAENSLGFARQLSWEGLQLRSPLNPSFSPNMMSPVFSPLIYSPSMYSPSMLSPQCVAQGIPNEDGMGGGFGGPFGYGAAAHH